MTLSRPNGTRPGRYFALAVSLLMALAACGTGEDSQTTDDDLALLEALPYAVWEDALEPDKRGVTIWDPERAWEGINLYTNDVDEAYLMDMEGRRLHTWTMPEGSTHCEYAVLMERGEIVAQCQGQWLVRLDFDSNIIWQTDLEVHHDIHVEDDQSLITLISSHARYRDLLVNFDAIVFVRPGGRIQSAWRLHNHLPEIQALHPPSPLDEGVPDRERKSYDYYHANAIQRLPETPLGQRDSRFRAGNLLLSLRNVSTILILDQDSMEPVWSWGPGEIEYQHTPEMLPSGNILIFDNGPRRGTSRIVELEPLSGRLVWRYEPNDPKIFFTRFQGSGQRLPNGNTLICESQRGRAFEVTPGGEVVWEFRNPDVNERQRRRRIYRFERLSRSEVAERMRRPAE